MTSAANAGVWRIRMCASRCVDHLDSSENVDDVDVGDQESAFRSFAIACHKLLVSELCISAETAAHLAGLLNPTKPRNLTQAREALASACRHRTPKETPTGLVLIALRAFPLAFTIVGVKEKTRVYANSKFSFK
jgi:hypothetical protein